MSKPTTCAGCIYNAAGGRTERGAGHYLCTHPNSADDGFWDNVFNYSCHSTNQPAVPSLFDVDAIESGKGAAA